MTIAIETVSHRDRDRPRVMQTWAKLGMTLNRQLNQPQMIHKAEDGEWTTDVKPFGSHGGLFNAYYDKSDDPDRISTTPNRIHLDIEYGPFNRLLRLGPKGNELAANAFETCLRKVGKLAPNASISGWGIPGGVKNTEPGAAMANAERFAPWIDYLLVPAYLGLWSKAKTDPFDPWAHDRQLDDAIKIADEYGWPIVIEVSTRNHVASLDGLGWIDMSQYVAEHVAECIGWVGAARVAAVLAWHDEYYYRANNHDVRNAAYIAQYGSMDAARDTIDEYVIQFYDNIAEGIRLAGEIVGPEPVPEPEPTPAPDTAEAKKALTEAAAHVRMAANKLDSMAKLL